jgi:hypothetical protein
MILELVSSVKADHWWFYYAPHTEGSREERRLLFETSKYEDVRDFIRTPMVEECLNKLEILRFRADSALDGASKFITFLTDFLEVLAKMNEKGTDVAQFIVDLTDFPGNVHHGVYERMRVLLDNSCLHFEVYLGVRRRPSGLKPDQRVILSEKITKLVCKDMNKPGDNHVVWFKFDRCNVKELVLDYGPSPGIKKSNKPYHSINFDAVLVPFDTDSLEALKVSRIYLARYAHSIFHHWRLPNLTKLELFKVGLDDTLKGRKKREFAKILCGSENVEVTLTESSRIEKVLEFPEGATITRHEKDPVAVEIAEKLRQISLDSKNQRKHSAATTNAAKGPPKKQLPSRRKKQKFAAATTNEAQSGTTTTTPSSNVDRSGSTATTLSTNVDQSGITATALSGKVDQSGATDPAPSGENPPQGRQKQCGDCRVLQALDQFWYPSRKGYGANCKTCRAEYVKRTRRWRNGKKVETGTSPVNVGSSTTATSKVQARNHDVSASGVTVGTATVDQSPPQPETSCTSNIRESQPLATPSAAIDTVAQSPGEATVPIRGTGDSNGPPTESSGVRSNKRNGNFGQHDGRDSKRPMTGGHTTEESHPDHQEVDVNQARINFTSQESSSSNPGQRVPENRKRTIVDLTAEEPSSSNSSTTPVSDHSHGSNNTTLGMKKCTKCTAWKPRDQFVKGARVLAKCNTCRNGAAGRKNHKVQDLWSSFKKRKLEEHATEESSGSDPSSSTFSHDHQQGEPDGQLNRSC